MQTFCQNKQTTAAAGKNPPLPGLRLVSRKDADWVTSLTAGIAFSLIGIGLVTILLLITRCCLYDNIGLNYDAGAVLFISLVFLAIGIAKILRGILLRKIEKGLSPQESTLDANKRQ